MKYILIKEDKIYIYSESLEKIRVIKYNDVEDIDISDLRYFILGNMCIDEGEIMGDL